jgi:hypothetical protein
MRTGFITFLIIASSLLRAQAPDTIKIRKPILLGVHYYKMKKLWFGGSFSCSEITRQDEILFNDSLYYFKVYGYTNKLILEGNKGPHGELHGDIKFYYKNGKLKKAEFYRTYKDCAKDTNAIICDGASPWGTWKYYDKKGRVRKTVVYSADRDIDKAYKTITTFGKKGEILSVKKLEHHPCEP